MGIAILVCLTGLVAGILTATEVVDRNVLTYLVPVIIAASCHWFWKPGRIILSRYRSLLVFAGFGCFFLAGYVSILTNRFIPGNSQAGSSEIIGKVVSYREVTEKLGQLVVRVNQESQGGVWEKRSGRMVFLLKPDRNVSYARGDMWIFGPVTITGVSSKPTKNGFVPSRYWLSRGVRYEARLSPGKSSLIRPGKGFTLAGYFGKWQQGLSNRIDRIGMAEPSRALIKAMIIGDRSDVESTTVTDFSRAGIIHVLSVSGLHVGIIYFIISWLLKKTGFPGGRIRSVISLLVVWVYAGVTGFSPSALRSAGMISLFEFARIGRRGTPGLEVLTSTAIIHCLIDPYTVFSAGAQLSYLAVAGIFIWNPVFSPIIRKKNRFGRYFANSISISIAAQCLIIPVLLFWFGWFPLYFLLGNLVLLPLLVFGFYLGMGITVLDIFGLTIPFICHGMDALIAFVTRGAGWLGNLPGNLVKPVGMLWCDLVLYYLVLFCIRAYCEKPDPRIVKGLVAGTGMILIVRYAGIYFRG